MKPNIHPSYQEATVRCGCGAVYHIPSTMATLEVEICSHCHPFYTGAKKIVDSAGRVERFKARLQKTAALKKVRAGKKQSKYGNASRPAKA